MAASNEPEVDLDVEKAKVGPLANRLLDVLGDAGHPATVLTALQYAVAAVCSTLGVQPEVFAECVAITMKRIPGGG